MEKPEKKPIKKVVSTDKKTVITKPENKKTQQVDKNYRPQGSDEQVGDGSAGIGGTSGI